MLDALFNAALESQGFTVAAFLLAIIALWRAVQGAQKSRVAALEKGFKKCLSQHERCERRNQKLVLAVVDAAQGRTREAMEKCRTLLDTRDDEDSDEWVEGDPRAQG
jgi:hypothetical protein